MASARVYNDSGPGSVSDSLRIYFFDQYDSGVDPVMIMGSKQFP